MIATYRIIRWWIARTGWPWITNHQEVIAGLMALLLAGRRGQPHVVAEDLPLPIAPRSKIARVCRMLANRKLDPVQVLLVSLVLDGRSLPLFWMGRNAHVNTPLKWWKRVLTPVIRLMRQHPELEEATWLVMADREFVFMPFARWLQQGMKAGDALRLKADLWLFFEDGTRCQVGDLPLAKGETKTWGAVGVTDAHQWPAQVCATWHPDADAPPVLMHSLPGPRGQPPILLASSGRRFHIEPTFSDFKSRGFDLERVRMTDPQRLTILLLVFVLVMLWCLLAGHDPETAGRTPAAPSTTPAPDACTVGSAKAVAPGSAMDLCPPSRLQRFLLRWLQALIRGSPLPPAEV